MIRRTVATMFLGLLLAGGPVRGEPGAAPEVALSEPSGHLVVLYQLD